MNAKKFRAFRCSRGYLGEMLQASAEQEGQKRVGGVTGRGWKPGQSGNPNGRRGEVRVNGKTLPELARAMTYDELLAVVEVRKEAHRILHTEGLPMSQRLQAGALCVQASNAILSRGWSDAPNKPEVLSSDFTFVIQQITYDGAPVPGVIKDGLPRSLPVPDVMPPEASG